MHLNEIDITVPAHLTLSTLWDNIAYTRTNSVTFQQNLRPLCMPCFASAMFLSCCRSLARTLPPDFTLAFQHNARSWINQPSSSREQAKGQARQKPLCWAGDGARDLKQVGPPRWTTSKCCRAFLYKVQAGRTGAVKVTKMVYKRKVSSNLAIYSFAKPQPERESK